MIRVLFIGMTPNPGGLETYMTYIFSSLQGKGFDFSFIDTSESDLAYSKLLRSKHGKIYKVIIPQHGIIRYLTRYLKAKRFFKVHHNFDIVHINAMTINQLYWAKAAKKYDVPHVIVQSHNNGVFYYSRIIEFLGKLLSIYNKLYINEHKDIIKLAATNSSGKWMFGADSNYKIVNIGMDADSYKYSRKRRNYIKKKLGLNTESKIVIITARIEKQKNYPKIIRIFRIMHKSNSNIKLVIVGTGQEKQMIFNLVKSYHLSKSTYFLGEVSKNEVKNLLAIGDLTLIPSFSEAIPFSILESQAAGVPAVVSDAIPSTANVTGKVKFLSLEKSDFNWAVNGLKLLKNNCNAGIKLQMNRDVKRSRFGLPTFIKRIRKVYAKICG